MTTIAKCCTRCKQKKPLDQFYVRSGCKNPTEPGHYNSECKSCLYERSKATGYLPPTIPRTKTEIYAIEALKKQGIHALPGKAVSTADVDVVAWGAVWVEVKYSTLKDGAFLFGTTPKQQQRGFLAHVVILICDYGDRMTFHLFDAIDPVFYVGIQHPSYNQPRPKTKSAITFVPGRVVPLKHGNNRVVMVQSMMDEAQDRWELIEQWRVELSRQIKNQSIAS